MSSEVVRAAVEKLCAQFKLSRYGLAPVVDLATLVAFADGVVDEAETEVFAETLRLLLTPKLPTSVIADLLAASLDNVKRVGIRALCGTVGNALADCGCVDEGLTLGIAVARSSNEISADERAALDAVAAAAGVPSSRVGSLVETISRDVSPRK